MAETLKVALLGERYLTKCKKGVIMVLGSTKWGLVCATKIQKGVSRNRHDKKRNSYRKAYPLKWHFGAIYGQISSKKFGHY